MTNTARAFYGLDGYYVEIQVEDPPFANRGGGPLVSGDNISDEAARETRIRVQAAISHLALPDVDPLKLPQVRIFGHRGGSIAHLDLSVAVAILEYLGKMRPEPLTFYFGELSVAGDIRPVRGIAVMLADVLKDGPDLFVPEENAQEAAWFGRFCRVRSARTLREVVEGTAGEHRPLKRPLPSKKGDAGIIVIGRAGVALQTARLLSGVLGFEQSEQLDRIYSAAGLLPPVGSVLEMPFRAPHHSVSTAGMVGGGKFMRPGEVSLAHRGVLFLDQIEDFKRETLEATFEAIRRGVVVHKGVVLPAAPALVVAGAEKETPRVREYMERFGLVPAVVGMIGARS